MRAASTLLLMVCVGCAPSRPLTSPYDLDGDGRDELLVVQSWNGRVRPLLLDGNLGPTAIQVGLRDVVRRIGDMNGDGRAELLVHDGRIGDGWLRIHSGRADGTADPKPYYERRFLLYDAEPAGDLDGDGLADLVVTTYPGGYFVVFGDPTAPAESDVVVAQYPRPAMDLNGDGINELLTSETSSDGSIYRVVFGGTQVVHEVHLAERLGRSFPDPSTPGRDVIVSLSPDDSSFSGVWSWNGSALERAAIEIPPGVPHGRGQIVGDEAIDALFAVRTETECVTHIGRPGSVHASVEGSCDSAGPTEMIVPGDLDEDGFDEVAYPERDAAAPYAYHLRVRGGGEVALTDGLTVAPVFEEATEPFVRTELWPAGDLDGDGISDLIGIGNGCAYVALGGSRLLVERFCDVSEDLPYETNSRPMVLGPLDEHAGDEVLFVGHLFSLAEATLHAVPAPEHLLRLGWRVGDIDGDGIEDWGTLDGVRRGTLELLVELGPVLLTPHSLMVGLGDVNGDGIDDLAVDATVRFGGPDVGTRDPDLDLSMLSDYVSVAYVGDRDGDGRADIAARWYAPDGEHAAIMTLRGGELVELERFTGPLQYAGDLDGDGRSEVASDRGLYFATGEVREDIDHALTVDVDGDGRDERLTTSPVMSGTSIRRWDGTALIDVPLERVIPFSEFALHPVR